MRVAVSVREGAISSTLLLLRRLRAGSRKSATYTAFREVGRVIRTVQLLRYLSDAPLRRRVTAATNKVEAFNGFSQWIGFGNGVVITDNDPVEQEKTAKCNALLTNAMIFHNALDIAEVVRQLQEEGYAIDPEDLAHISPYLTEHIKRFGEYSTHELGIQPEAYDPKLNVDFTRLRVTARQQVEAIAAALGREVPFAEVSRQQAHAQMAAVFGAEAADAVLDVMGGDVNDELLAVRDTVSQVTGTPARPFQQWATENAVAFR
jgi:Transposase and inactivated derivatives, TnpA family